MLAEACLPCLGGEVLGAMIRLAALHMPRAHDQSRKSINPYGQKFHLEHTFMRIFGVQNLVGWTMHPVISFWRAPNRRSLGRHMIENVPCTQAILAILEMCILDIPDASQCHLQQYIVTKFPDAECSILVLIP